MIENLLNMIRQRQARPRYAGRHRADPPQQRRPESSEAVPAN
ncbi:MAG: hypothetical protein ACRDT4_11495 [Micromonosporaceae bacterium]